MIVELVVFAALLHALILACARPVLVGPVAELLRDPHLLLSRPDAGSDFRQRHFTPVGDVITKLGAVSFALGREDVRLGVAGLLVVLGHTARQLVEQVCSGANWAGHVYYCVTE